MHRGSLDLPRSPLLSLPFTEHETSNEYNSKLDKFLPRLSPSFAWIYQSVYLLWFINESWYVCTCLRVRVSVFTYRAISKRKIFVPDFYILLCSIIFSIYLFICFLFSFLNAKRLVREFFLLLIWLEKRSINRLSCNFDAKEKVVRFTK